MGLPGVSLLATEQKATDWAGTTDLFWVWKFKPRTQVGLVSQSARSEGSEGRRCSQPASVASPCPSYHPPPQPSRYMILRYFVQDAGLTEL